MDTLTIREIVNQVERGQIRIPAFQRGFVWEPDRVAFFMDSVYKKYPFGALLFWRTNEKLDIEKKLGPFELPEPQVDYPIDYVLDGQQRITSIYATFQTREELDDSEDWKDIYYNLTIEDNAQETQFYAVAKEEVEDDLHFPLRVLFDTTEYRKATKDLSDKLAERIDEVQSVFKEALIPVQNFRAEDKGTVSVIFERINRQGVPLNTMQLLSAWTWSEEFQLQNQFEELSEELEDFGYIPNIVDENLLLRCASAVLVRNPKPEAIVEITGEEIRKRFDEVENGIKGSLDFLRSNLGIQRIDNLPFQTILVPLSVFFAVVGNTEVKVTETQRIQLLKWFWRTCFTRRYSSGVLRHLTEDIEEIIKLREQMESSLGDIPMPSYINQFFIWNKFGIRNVNTKTFILLLAQQDPLSFISGTPVDLSKTMKEYNKTEFHHLMPKKYLQSLDMDELSPHMNCLANFCFLSRAENRDLGGEKPSEYRHKIAAGNFEEILASACCPEELFTDNYAEFVTKRSLLLVEKANGLAGW